MNQLDSLSEMIQVCVDIAYSEYNQSPSGERGAALYQVSRELSRIAWAVRGVKQTTTPSDPFLDAVRAGAEPETHGRTPTTEEIEDARNHLMPYQAAFIKRALKLRPQPTPEEIEDAAAAERFSSSKHRLP